MAIILLSLWDMLVILLGNILSLLGVILMIHLLIDLKRNGVINNEKKR